MINRAGIPKFTQIRRVMFLCCNAIGWPGTDHMNPPRTDLQTASINSKLSTTDVDIT